MPACVSSNRSQTRARDDATCSRRLIGEELVARGVLSETDLARGLRLQRTTGRRIGETLVDLKLITSIEFTRILAEHMNVPFVDLSEVTLDPDLADLLPEHVARRYKCIPVGVDGTRVRIAMANPNDLFAVDELRTQTDRFVEIGIAETSQLADAIDQMYTDRVHQREVNAELVDRILMDGVPHTVFEALDVLRPYMLDAQVARRVPGEPVVLSIQIEMRGDRTCNR
jgi:hypothetical protein